MESKFEGIRHLLIYESPSSQFAFLIFKKGEKVGRDVPVLDNSLSILPVATDLLQKYKKYDI